MSDALDTDRLPLCRLCGAEVTVRAAKLCDSCWDLQTAIHRRREVALRICAELVFEPTADWPVQYPGAFQHWPATLRKTAGQLLMRYWAETFGPGDLVKQITTSQFGQTALKRLADVPPTPSLTAGAAEWWPFFLLVARAQVDLSARPIPSSPSPSE